MTKKKINKENKINSLYLLIMVQPRCSKIICETVNCVFLDPITSEHPFLETAQRQSTMNTFSRFSYPICVWQNYGRWVHTNVCVLFFRSFY